MIENECVIYEGLMVKYLLELNYIKAKDVITKLIKNCGENMCWYLLTSTIKDTNYNINDVEIMIKECCINSGMDAIDALIQSIKIKHDILSFGNDTEDDSIYKDIEKLESLNVETERLINLYTLALQISLVRKDTNRIISISSKLESFV